MAAESLFGGGTGTTPTFDDKTKSFIDSILLDTRAGTAQQVTLASGGTTKVVGVIGTGQNGETQGALVGGTSGVSGTVNDGTLKFNLNLPANVDMAFVGQPTAQNTTQTQTDLQHQIQTAFGGSTNPAVQQEAASLTQAANTLTQVLANQGATNVITRTVSFSDQSTGATGGTIVVDTSASQNKELLALSLNTLHQGSTVQLKGVEAAALVGNGSVQVADNTNTIVHGDLGNQLIVGGSGNDTLIGGGGNDTLVGGSGNNTFGFNSLGHYSVTMNAAQDKLAFPIPGITSVDQLAKFVTGIHQDANGVTFDFGPNASITLTGMTAEQITASMLKFSL